MSWIDDFLKECEDVETPRNWLYWSAISTIAAIAAPNVTLNKQGKYIIRPNLFVLLMGRSGLGKGFGISAAKRLVADTKSTRIISGRSTIEGIINELTTSRSTVNGEVPFKDARGFIVSGEFASSLHKNPDALTILTDLADAHYNQEWINTLKNSPVEKLKFPCLNLLSGANQDMFDLAVDKAHIQGGFVGRTILIPADKRAKANPLIDEVTEDFPYEKLGEHLKTVAKTKGQFKFSPKAKEVYKEWFFRFREAEVDDKTGTYDRLNDSVLKVAMCLSLASKFDLMLEEENIVEAIEAVSNLTGTAKQVTSGQGKSSTAQFVKVFLSVIMRAPDYTMLRSDILRSTFGDLNSIEMDTVVEYLTGIGFLKQSTTNPIVYKVSESGIRFWENTLKRKS